MDKNDIIRNCENLQTSVESGKHGFVERKMQKAVTMKDCKDRNEQFEKIHELKEEYSKSENPIISMDVKKRVFR